MNGNDQIPVVKRPHWVDILTGRLAEQICPYARKPCPDESCQLRYSCKCAQEQSAAASRLENRMWGVLAACGAAVIVYWFVGS